MALVLTCADYDESTETCLVEAWVETPMGIFPELSSSDAALIAGAWFVAFSIAYLFRFLFSEAKR